MLNLYQVTVPTVDLALLGDNLHVTQETKYENEYHIKDEPGRGETVDLFIRNRKLRGKFTRTRRLRKKKKKREEKGPPQLFVGKEKTRGREVRVKS